jgi:CubicO group peptidase (beta-lactamase class C family)
MARTAGINPARSREGDRLDSGHPPPHNSVGRMPILRTVSATAVILLVLLDAGCARSTPARVIGPDESQGFRLLEENLRHPGVDTLTDTEIQTILQDNVGPGGQADGLVVGIVDERGPRIVMAGSLGDGTDRPVDGDTLFKIGSITKVFTAVLL